ncbi:hypothetical protein OJF2_58930 [Aquisphaera giovannonii]|uniref:DUF1501 domain-containing protein n=1 Tax=Aquisphaera giovannonii TaxID=406548 RepID=A0A5B9W9S4_9BACT|nr:DUF1501 domain-containing protein [Aquisphaera giovannonii]QEH37303.1 hypothetical protein OJF2_58930 [Aquisphaera giovannonii]
MSDPHHPAGHSDLRRRDLLKAGALGFLGLGLGDWLRLRSLAGTPSSATAPARNCILIWLAGGPSHIDTFDPKPGAPADVRGEFKPIATSVPGLQVSEIFPELAKVMDRVTLIRSMTSPEADHDRASHHKLTGYRPSPALVYPSHGSVVARVRESSPTGTVLPPYVAIPDGPASSGAGYLSPAYDPFVVGGDPSQEGFRVQNLTPPDKVTLTRLLRRKAMVQALDEFSRDVPPTTLTTSRDRFAERAYSLMTSNAAQAAFRLADEKPEVRDRYGRNPFGQSCLLARRLIEAGVSFVTLNDRGAGPLGWDTHAQNFPTLKDTLAPPLDKGLTALLGDLSDRGLLKDTLLVMMGEFGRTPKINPNAGRDHHGRASSLILAGAGIPGGLVLGRTDARGDLPTDRPVTPADLAALVYLKLGIDPDRKFEAPDGRPIRLVENGQPPRELL